MRFTLALALSVLVALSNLAYAGTGDKFRDVYMGSYPPGSRIPFTTRELTGYIDAQIPLVIGPGVRNARLETDNGNIVRGFLDIDFLKVRQAHGEKPSWLMTELLSGERPVAITVRLTSAHGKARVDVLSVSISGMVAEGKTLDFLIAHFVLPSFPDVKVGQDFALGFKIDHFEIVPGTVTVALRGR